MPKRRKRSTLANKPSLVFTESPVSIQNNVPSPVFCARHPPTAKSIPIEELDELPWVSPQFKNAHGSGGKRVTRQRRRSKAFLQSLTNKENTWHGARQVIDHNKYRSLKFIGDQTTVNSFDDDPHISVDSDTGTDEDSARVIIVQGCARRHGTSKSKHSEVISDRGDPDTDPCTCQGRPTPTCDKHITHEGKSVDVGSDKKDDLDESSQIYFPNLQKEIINKAPVKRLFSSQLPNGTPVLTDGHQDSGHETVASVCESESDTLTRVSESDRDSGSGEDVISPPIRRSLRLLALRNIMNTDQTPRLKRCSRVLAPDTPEEEYGWPIRKQQLKRQLHQR